MVVPIAGSLAALILLVLLIVPTIRYRVTKKSLVITAVGVPVRWVSLTNIRYLTDHSKGRAESWPNCFSSVGRALYIRKRRGLFRSLMITPDKRFVFKAEVEQAIRELIPKASFNETTFYDRPTPKGQSIKPEDPR
jgi:hypothetical protein